MTRGSGTTGRSAGGSGTARGSGTAGGSGTTGRSAGGSGTAGRSGTARGSGTTGVVLFCIRRSEQNEIIENSIN